MKYYEYIVHLHSPTILIYKGNAKHCGASTYAQLTEDITKLQRMELEERTHNIIVSSHSTP